MPELVVVLVALAVLVVGFALGYRLGTRRGRLLMKAVRKAVRAGRLKSGVCNHHFPSKPFKTKGEWRVWACDLCGQERWQRNGAVA